MHTIRIHGPWLYSVSGPDAGASHSDGEIQSDGDVPATGDWEPDGKIKIPGDLSQVVGVDFRGPVHLRRNFGCPTGVEATDQLWLVFESIIPKAKIELNGDLLATVDQFPVQFDVTKKMGLRNRIDLQLQIDEALNANSLGGLVGEVRLEIRSPE